MTIHERRDTPQSSPSRRGYFDWTMQPEPYVPECPRRARMTAAPRHPDTRWHSDTFEPLPWEPVTRPSGVPGWQPRRATGESRRLLAKVKPGSKAVPAEADGAWQYVAPHFPSQRAPKDSLGKPRFHYFDYWTDPDGYVVWTPFPPYVRTDPVTRQTVRASGMNWLPARRIRCRQCGAPTKVIFSTQRPIRGKSQAQRGWWKERNNPGAWQSWQADLELERPHRETYAERHVLDWELVAERPPHLPVGAASDARTSGWADFERSIDDLEADEIIPDEPDRNDEPENIGSGFGEGKFDLEAEVASDETADWWTGHAPASPEERAFVSEMAPLAVSEETAAAYSAAVEKMLRDRLYPGLTPKQREKVIAYVYAAWRMTGDAARGVPMATIAAAEGITTQAVEARIHALSDAAQAVGANLAPPPEKRPGRRKHRFV